MIKIFEKIKNIFRKEEEEDLLTAESLFPEEEEIPEHSCDDCLIKKYCTKKGKMSDLCKYAIDIKGYDKNKDTILIIDDNKGVISFLMDDIEYLDEEKIINLKTINVITISGTHAAFTLELLYSKLEKLSIKWAIIDITLGGSAMTEKGNLKYTGVDVFEMINKNKNTPKDFKFLFYTGNNLNPYIKANEKIINQFKELTGDDIKNYVLFKTSMDIDSRREYIINHIFQNQNGGKKWE